MRRQQAWTRLPLVLASLLACTPAETLLAPPPHPSAEGGSGDLGAPCEFDSWCRSGLLCDPLRGCQPRSAFTLETDAGTSCRIGVLVDVSDSMREDELSFVRDALRQWGGASWEVSFGASNAEEALSEVGAALTSMDPVEIIAVFSDEPATGASPCASLVRQRTRLVVMGVAEGWSCAEVGPLPLDTSAIVHGLTSMCGASRGDGL